VTRASLVGRVAAIAALVLCVSSAWAQDYTVTTATGLLETRPASATVYTTTSGGLTEAARDALVHMPFSIPYYCTTVQDITVSAFGFILPRSVTAITNQVSNSLAHGQDATSGAFPYTTPGSGGAQYVDGLIAPIWRTNVLNDSVAPNSRLYTWTTGTAPTRHFVVSWDSGLVGATGGTPVTYQVLLYEGTGRIVFAYTTTGTYAPTGSGYVCGIDSPIDSRFTAPLAGTNSNGGYPGSDFIFDPKVATYTGTVLYDKLVSDATGIGNSVLANTPLDGLRVELQRSSDGYAYAGATTASDGSFSITGYALPAGTPGVVATVASNAACSVSASSAALRTAWPFIGSQSFTTGGALGTWTLGSSADANGDLRAALNIARVCGKAYAWASARTTDSIPQLSVLHGSASSVATTYNKANGTTPPSMTIASRAAPNPDAWDDAIIARTYGRHVLASITAPPVVSYDDRFDAVTDTQNAFAEAFGYYIWAVVSGSSQAIDGTGPSPAVVHDLESPSLTVTPADDVAGSMAAALYDLADGANETIDVYDGTAVSDRVFRAVDSMASSPVQGTFRQAWIDAGYDAAALTRIFIGNKVLTDDAFEPNDSVTEPASLVGVGFVRHALVLNSHNEDWFGVHLPADASSLMADAKYDSLLTGAAVGVEIRTAAGALVATGTLNTGTGAVHVATGAIAAGDYRVGVRHLSGNTVPTYEFQVFVPPSMDAVPVRNWTVGRPYDRPLGAADGVAPYSVSASSGALPPGLVFDAPTMRVFGTPSTVGAFQVTVKLIDGGSPANITQRSETVTIQDVLKIAVARFVGFPLGKSADTTLPTTGGTPPFTLSMTTGALPAGLAFDPNSLHVTGTVTAAPSSTFELDGADVAGSTDHVATRGVVAHPASGKNVPADLVAGVDACGWWFDAVEGSTVSFTAATAKKQAKRTLAGVVLAPDRLLVLRGKIKAKTGSLAGSGFLCPLSGRYYVIASSTDGDATQLLGNVVVAPPKAGKAKPETIAPSDTRTIEIGALPGATLSVKFAGEKKTTLVAKVVSVTDPNGAQIAWGTFVKASATGGTLTMPLAVGGTWTIVLGATSTSGNAGKFSYSYTIKQPKGAAYEAP
jgi:hypothetical protein